MKTDTFQAKFHTLYFEWRNACWNLKFMTKIMTTKFQTSHGCLDQGLWTLGFMVVHAVQIKKLNGFELDIFGNAFLFDLFIERNRVVRGQVMDRKKDERSRTKRKICKPGANLHHPHEDYICCSMCNNC